MLRLAAPFVGAVLLLAAFPSGAAGDVFNGRIAFVSDRDGGDFDIFTTSPAGDDVRLLTKDNTRNDHQPDWHPSGTALAFRAEVARRFQVWRMEADGDDQKALVTLLAPREASQPSWFPDASGLLLRRSGQAAGDAFRGGVYRADLLNNSQEFFSFLGRQWYPSWSPQMTKVLIAMTMSEPADTDRGIFTVDPATLATTPLFDLPDVFDSAPAWRIGRPPDRLRERRRPAWSELRARPRDLRHERRRDRRDPAHPECRARRGSCLVTRRGGRSPTPPVRTTPTATSTS